MVVIRVVLVGKGGGSNFDFAVFMAAGFIAFNMFRHILTSSLGAFQANKPLFLYKQVKPLSTVLSRVLLEVFFVGIIVIIFILIGFFFHYEFMPQNLLMVVAGYMWLLLFSIGVGVLVAVGNAFFVSVGKFVGTMTLGLLLFSAVFYPMADVPYEAQEYLLYNPLVHFMEMIHGYYIPELDDRFVDYHYMLLWTVTPFFMAFWLYAKLERRIISK